MLRNLASMSSLNLFKAGVQFAIGTLIALFVLPAEYGLITFALPIIQLIALMTDLGLGSALIRQRDLSAEDAGAALALSLAIAAASGALLALLSVPIQGWAQMPGLSPVLNGMALATAFTIVAAVPRALLERDLHYQRIALAEGVATMQAALLCAGLVVLAEAGIWGLVAFHAALQAARALAFLVLTRRRYRFTSEWTRAVPLIRFGGWVLASNLVNFLARNAQGLLIGATLGASAVGLYGIAYQVMILPLMALAWPASGVLLATLSRLRERDDGKRHATFAAPVLALSLLTATLTFPLMSWIAIGLAFPAQRLLAPEWHHALPLIAALAPLGAIQALASYNGAVLIAAGRPRLQFAVSLISSLVLLAGFLLSLRFGLHVFVLTYLGLGAAVAAAQIGTALWCAALPPAMYLRNLAVSAAATATGLASAALYGMAPSNWQDWAGMTLIYWCAVGAVSASARRPILRAVRGLLPA